MASDNVTQHAELVEEEDKFLRLLQVLGEQVEGTKKVIVFCDTQVRADSLFEQLLRSGYPALSLHAVEKNKKILTRPFMISNERTAPMYSWLPEWLAEGWMSLRAPV